MEMEPKKCKESPRICLKFEVKDQLIKYILSLNDTSSEIRITAYRHKVNHLSIFHALFPYLSLTCAYLYMTLRFY
jgi:hypothetical protein